MWRKKIDLLQTRKKEWRNRVKTFYKKLFAFVAMISVVALGLSIIKPVFCLTVTPTITNLKADTSGQKLSPLF